MPESISAAPATPQPKPQCRALTTDGHRCRSTVLNGLHLCYSHYHHRFPALPDPDHVSLPLLEDGPSIRLLMTQVAHGLLSMKLDPVRARTTIWAAQVAWSTLPRPARLTAPEPPGDPVHRIGFDHESLISADGDLSELNHLCSVPAAAEAIPRNTVNQPAPEFRYTDPAHPAPPPQPIPAPYDVPPPPPPEPLPAHESGLPCDCPPCTERREAFLLRYHGPGKKPAPVDNPLCPSGKPACLGPDSEFCCRACHATRKERAAAEPSAGSLSLDASALPGAEGSGQQSAFSGQRSGHREQSTGHSERSAIRAQSSAAQGTAFSDQRSAFSGQKTEHRAQPRAPLLPPRSPLLPRRGVIPAARYPRIPAPSTTCLTPPGEGGGGTGKGVGGRIGDGAKDRAWGRGCC